jgi:transcriptional regulator with XRE-family HTH domain
VLRYRIKECAGRRGYSMRRLAYEAHISESRLRQLANNRPGLANVTVRTLERIAGELQVTLSDLIEPVSLSTVPERPSEAEW